MWSLLDRFKEPSSYAGVATVLTGLGVNINPGLFQTSVYIAAGLCGLASFVMKEGK